MRAVAAEAGGEGAKPDGTKYVLFPSVPAPVASLVSATERMFVCLPAFAGFAGPWVPQQGPRGGRDFPPALPAVAVDGF